MDRVGQIDADATVDVLRLVADLVAGFARQVARGERLRIAAQVLLQAITELIER